MQLRTVKFNKQDRPEFYKVLNKRVNQYFKDRKISKHANGRMVFKTVFMLLLYFVPLAMLLTGLIDSFWVMLLMWVLMGMGMSGIGLSIMHDANHGSYSKHQWVNNMLGFVLNFVGGYHIDWRIQHNVLHHSYTNVHGMDEDIDKGIIRFSPDQERKGIHRYQAYYALFVYSIMTIYWFLAKDFMQVTRYRRKQLLEGQGLTFGRALFEIITFKIGYIILTIVLPIWLIDLPWWQVIIGCMCMHFICGLALALIFQPAHVIEETDFYKADENGSVENNWAIHQMKTTANFAHGSRLFSWFIGGLNYQIEHHLFPHICHVHYRRISKIVKQTAKEFNVPYYEHRTFLGALKSHFSLLYLLGTGKYEQLGLRG